MRVLVFLLILCCVVNSSLAFSGCFDSTSVLPIPARAFGNIQTGAAFYVEKFTSETSEEGVYFATNGGYNAIFIVSRSDGIVVFDAPPSGSWLLHAIQNVSSIPVKTLVYGHSHRDHIGDARDFKDATIIAHVATSEFLRSRAREGSVDIPLPDIDWCDSYSFEHGNYQIEMSSNEQQSAHIAGNAMIWIPKAKALMHVDIIYPRWCPFHRNGEAENITALPANIDAILAFPFDKFVGGHVGRWGTRDDVEEMKEFALDLISVADSTGTLPPDDFYPILQTGNLWNFLRTWYDTMACNCAQQMADRWGDTIAGVDIYAESHCYQIQESMRIGADLNNLVYPSKFPPERCNEDASQSNSPASSNSDSQSNSSILVASIIVSVLFVLLLL